MIICVAAVYFYLYVAAASSCSTFCTTGVWNSNLGQVVARAVTGILYVENVLYQLCLDTHSVHAGNHGKRELVHTK